MSEIDAIINAVNRISLLGQLRDKVWYATEAQRDRCGSCFFWMKSRDCPREKNVGGMSRGPSRNDGVCAKFKITQSAVDLRLRRIAEAVDFAREHNLPPPDAFLVALTSARTTPNG